MSGRIQFQFALGRQPASGPREEETRRILVLADCLGEGDRESSLADRKPLPIDIDRFDAVLARFAPRLRIPLDGAPDSEVLIDIRRLDDFHPDEIFRRLPAFKVLREMRQRLENPATFEAAAAELRQGMTHALTPATPPATGQTGGAPPAPEGAGESLFEHLLGKKPGPSKPLATAREDAVHRVIRHIVEPHLTQGADPDEQRQWLAVVDDAAERLMRRILHHPAFQRLESVWRGLHWLMGRIEDGEALRVFLLDASEAELAADLAAADGTVERTRIYRLLTESSIGVPGGEPWSLVLGTYPFGSDAASLDLLELLGAVSAGCGGSFVGNAHANLPGCASLASPPDATGRTEPPAELAERWHRLRQSPPAQHIGLALPRFLLRLPYGEKSDPIESFRFEEMPAHPPHETYLWGNPAFACGALIANAWIQGDESAAGTMREIGDLPCHTYDEDGEKAMKPCAESYLSENTAHAILGNGIMVLLSVRNRNSVLVPSLRTISQPPLSLL